MQQLVLSKLVSKKKTPQFTLEQLNSGECFALQSELDSIEGWQGSMSVGRMIRFSWTGRIFCTNCSKQSKKLVNGFCFECLNSRASADSCVMSPHLCHYLSGTCREPEWGLAFCYQPHVVYLSYTGEFKVGITRLSQVPTRWFDQGATWARVLALVGSRHQAGVIEKTLAQYLSDRTNWQKMLKCGNERPNAERIQEWSERLKELSFGSARTGASAFGLRVNAPPRAPWAGSITWVENSAQFELNYPTAQLDTVPQSLSLEKTRQLCAKLEGIKGQYLIFSDMVMNVRKHEGFEIELSLETY